MYRSAPGSETLGAPVALSNKEESSAVVLIASVTLKANLPVRRVSAFGLSMITSVASTFTK